jgi:hypothetical protein
MRARLLIATGLVLALGCGGRVAPVSGTVTLNGQPLPNALVSFQPIAPEGGKAAGPGSTGTTNEKGEFSLKTAAGQTGAYVCKHRVIISVVSAKPGGDDKRRGGPPMEEKVPARYNNKSELTFDVPSGGTRDAKFELKSP